VRTFVVGACVGLLVVLLGYPLAYFLVRTRSRWKGLLIALALAPLLASVVVRTYGWYIILNRFGVANDLLLSLGVIDDRIAFMPSTGAIIVGLAHALLPYTVLTIMGSLQGINPNLELAAMSLGGIGASRDPGALLAELCGFLLAAMRRRGLSATLIEWPSAA